MADWLVHPRLPLHLALIAVALCLPALGAGFQLDDYMQRTIMLDRAAHEVEAMEAVSVMKGENLHLSEYVEFGLFPWWTAPDLRLAFFRYLTVATVWLDYRLWPDSAPLMHLHSLLWLAALLAVTAVFYRHVMGATVAAGLAAMLYALDEAHAGAASWLANRNALTATFFGVACLVAHDRWRRGGRRWGAWAGPLLLALALASGEMALGAVAYLAAYALFLDPSGKRRGTLALGAHVGVVALWVLLYRLGGYGARGSGLYLDPLGDARAYLAALPQRLPMLLLGQWTAISADAAWLLPPERAHTAWIVALVTCGVLAAWLAPTVRRSSLARFWGVGMLLSMLPVAATFPSNRLLFFPGVGAMALAALLMTEAFTTGQAAASALWRRAARVLAVLLVLQHLVLAPLTTPLAAAFIRDMGEPAKRAEASLPNDASMTDRDLIIVNTPDYLTFVTFVATARAAERTTQPRRLRALSAGPTPITVTRLDRETLRVRMEGGLYSGPLGELFRSRDRPLPAGTITELPGWTITVVKSDDSGTPVVVDYRFSTALEDPQLYWVRWNSDGYAPWTPPQSGDSVSLPAATGPFEQMAELFPF